MFGKTRYGRPNRFYLLALMVLNGLIAYPVLNLALWLFGVREILPSRLAQMSGIGAAARWDVVWPLLPGAAIAFGCLWFWLILTGRSRGVSWSAACIYGVGIALGNTIAGGFLLGLLHGDLNAGLLLALISLALLLILPTLLLAMSTFGILMGLLNGWLAQQWIDHLRAKG